MGAFLAASTHAPLTSVLMIFEMTENYGLVAPLMLACVLAFSVSRLLRPESIYASSQRAKAATDPRMASARDLLRPESITARPGDSIGEVERRLVESRWRHVYVVDEQGLFRGASRSGRALAGRPAAAELPAPDAGDAALGSASRVRNASRGAAAGP
jgi:CIC family chloride channel protein